MADWIRLPRSMFDWDWFDKPEMLSLFLYLLNNAKEKEVKHDGIVEHRGQFLTSLGKLSTTIGAGKQVVRTCLSKLIKMQLIEVNTERLYSIITICNYDDYFEAEVNKPKNELKNEDTKPVEAPKEDKPKKTKEEIAAATEKRKKKFGQDLVPYVATYGKDMIRKFYDYWSETNKSKTRMRCETEKTWDLNLRLQNWARRKDFGTKQSGTALHNSENKDYNEGGW